VGQASIDVEIARTIGEPVGSAQPAVLYGLGNILENAVDSPANGGSEGDLTEENVAVEVTTTSGFPPEIMTAWGEP